MFASFIFPKKKREVFWNMVFASFNDVRASKGQSPAKEPQAEIVSAISRYIGSDWSTVSWSPDTTCPVFCLEEKASVPVCGLLMKLSQSMDRGIEWFKVGIDPTSIEV
jgi:hypothetical protein